MHEEFVHVVVEVGVPHEARAPVLRKVTANTTRVAGGAGVKHHAKLVIVDVVSVSTDFPKVVLHVDGQLELSLDYVNERVLRDRALFGWKAAQRHKGVHLKKIKFIKLTVLI